MNTLRLYALVSCFILLLQPAGAQEPAPAPDAPPPLDVTALCAEGPAICALAQRVQLMENEVVEPKCHTLPDGSLWCVSDPWPPPCNEGYEWWPVVGCQPVMIIETFAERSSSINMAEAYSWPVWWPRPWDIPRPPYPYPWQFGPLPDPWQELALQQRLGIALPGTANMTVNSAVTGGAQLAMPVLIGTDQGTEIIPDFCLKAEWEEGKIPPECSGLAGLVRKLGLSPEDAPLLQAAP